LEKLLEASCPNHAYPIKHKLKECTMLRYFMTSGALSKGKKPKGGPGGHVATTFLGEEVVMSIYGGPVPHESRCKLKLMSWEVHAVSPAIPQYLRWSESPINFDWIDHPDCVVSPYS
jgi:hypothetical protein